MIKLEKRFLILLLSIAVFTSQLLGGTQGFADTLGETDVNDDFLFEDIPYLPLDPSTVIDLDKNPNYIEEPSNSKDSCNYKSYSQTSNQGSKILLVGDQFSYGYCHIKARHMQITGLNNQWVGDASQFFGPYTSLGMMNLAMEVINGTTELKPADNNDPNRFYKEFYISSFERSTVRVIIHRGSNWVGYGDYDWIIVSAYPRFMGGPGSAYLGFMDSPAFQ